MNKSDSIKNLSAALVKFQAEVQNPANTANNPFYKSKYAPLHDILSQNRPLLSKHGLSVIQSPGGDGANISITTLLIHESGEWIESDPLILKAEKATAQGAGSAITYGRRYGISALLGISSEDDDDGSHASQGNGKQQTGKNDKPEQQVPPTGQPSGSSAGTETTDKPPAQSTEPVIYCDECTLAIVDDDPKKVKAYSEKYWNRCLCRDCQKKVPKKAS